MNIHMQSVAFYQGPQGQRDSCSGAFPPPLPRRDTRAEGFRIGTDLHSEVGFVYGAS